MFELIVNVPFETVLRGPDNVTPPVPALYLGSAVAGVNPICAQIGSTVYWTVSFTPNATGLYTLFAFSTLQFRAACNSKSLTSMVKNIEDEALGSWTWDKTTGVLTILRQDGSTLATHTALDTLTEASRERVS